MKVYYTEPKDNKRYLKWFDNNGKYDIWYEKATMLFDYNEADIPLELKNFLDKWSKKIEEYKENYVELYPVKLAHIEFIYNDVVYSIYPNTIKATYMTSFLSDKEYEVEWDSLFETYQRKIRDDMEKELGVKYSRYWGFLD